MWVPQSWQVQLVGDAAFGAGTRPVTLRSAFPQPGGATIPGGTADGAGGLRRPGTERGSRRPRSETEKSRSFTSGPSRRFLDRPSKALREACRKARRSGVVNAVEGPGNALTIDTRFACGTAPCFMVGGQDAWFLDGDRQSGGDGVLDKLKLSLALASEEKRGLTSANGVATIPGQSAKRIIINAHADGYFQGGDDNASGLAVLVGLARYFAKQPQPKHTLMFVASGGHHGPGNGPTSLLAAHPELKDNTRADHQPRARRVSRRGSRQDSRGQ